MSDGWRYEIRERLAVVPDRVELKLLGSYCGDKASLEEGRSLYSSVLGWLAVAAVEERAGRGVKNSWRPQWASSSSISSRVLRAGPWVMWPFVLSTRYCEIPRLLAGIRCV